MSAAGRLLYSTRSTPRDDDGDAGEQLDTEVIGGASERAVRFPGWTLPGVIGLAAATIMLKSQRMLPGRATIVAGCGPLLMAVAAGALKYGGRVIARSAMA